MVSDFVIVRSPVQIQFNPCSPLLGVGNPNARSVHSFSWWMKPVSFFSDEWEVCVDPLQQRHFVCFVYTIFLVRCCSSVTAEWMHAVGHAGANSGVNCSLCQTGTYGTVSGLDASITLVTVLRHLWSLHDFEMRVLNCNHGITHRCCSDYCLDYIWQDRQGMGGG